MLNEKIEHAAKMMQFGQDLGEKIRQGIAPSDFKTLPLEQIQEKFDEDKSEVVAWLNSPVDINLQSEAYKAEMRKYALSQAVKRAEDHIGARLREVAALARSRPSTSWLPYVLIAFLAGSTLTMIAITWLTKKHPAVAL